MPLPPKGLGLASVFWNLPEGGRLILHPKVTAPKLPHAWWPCQRLLRGVAMLFLLDPSHPLSCLPLPGLLPSSLIQRGLVAEVVRSSLSAVPSSGSSPFSPAPQLVPHSLTCSLVPSGKLTQSTLPPRPHETLWTSHWHTPLGAVHTLSSTAEEVLGGRLSPHFAKLKHKGIRNTEATLEKSKREPRSLVLLHLSIPEL